MKPRTAARLAWSTWSVTMVAIGAALALTVTNPAPTEDLGILLVTPLAILGFATVGAVVSSRRPRNPIGWLFLGFAFTFTLVAMSDEYAAMAVRRDIGPTALRSAAIWMSNVVTVVGFAALPLVFLLFPGGTLPSPRWRPVAWAMVALPLLGGVGLAIRPGPAGGSVQLPNPTGVQALEPLASALMTIGGIGSVVAAIACVAGLVVRFRRAGGEERQQIRWLAYTAAAAAVLLVATFGTSLLGREPLLGEILFLGFLVVLMIGVPVASGAAILKYRLFDLDVVLKKAIVFGILSVFVGAAYAMVVILIPGLLFGRGGEAQDLIPFIAAGALALAFQPVRRWAGRLANRLVYGHRATPYEVLAGFSGRMAAEFPAEDVLVELARTLGEGSGASRADVWLHVGGDLRREATWPHDRSGASIPIRGQDLPRVPDADHVAPVRDRGELLGALAVKEPRGTAFTGEQQRLIDDLASHAGLVLRNVRLIEELRASRQRLVAAQDEERRRLERNIHDGAQQQLVALSVKLRLIEAMVDKDPAKAKALAAETRAESQEALENLRDLARGIYPPLLADKGLVAALEAQARKVPFPVLVERDGVGRYPPEAEATAYFCVLEALQNAVKYAEASQALVRLRQEEGELVFTVSDDGRGFDPAATPRGSGLQNIADRLEALGGTLHLRSAPGAGTSLTGRLPVPEERS